MLYIGNSLTCYLTCSLTYLLLNRDLKPENLLLKTKTDDFDIKIADFGFAIQTKDSGLQTQCGTLLTHSLTHSPANLLTHSLNLFT